MNIPNAIKLRDQLLSLPGKFDYGKFANCKLTESSTDFGSTRLATIQQHPCSTAACVAGWCSILNHPDILELGYTSVMDGWSARYLGLTRDEQKFLFYPSSYNSEVVGYIGVEHDIISMYSLQDAIDRLNWLISKHND